MNVKSNFLNSNKDALKRNIIRQEHKDTTIEKIERTFQI